MDPTRILIEGSKILEPMLSNHGFTFKLTDSGKGSGGFYAVGQYTRGDRKLEFHFRESLGLVTYWIGDTSASHETYIRELGINANQYPGHSEDPLDGFRHLAHDLAHYAADFLTGGGEVLSRASSAENVRENMRSQTQMVQSSGDIRLREEARRLFHAKNYAGAVSVFGQVKYPELMSESEQSMLRIARARL